MPQNVIHFLGYALIVLFGIAAFIGVVVAALGHVADNQAARLMAKSVSILFYVTPVWTIICYKGYEYGWVFGTHRYIWVVLTLTPLLILFALFQIFDQDIA